MHCCEGRIDYKDIKYYPSGNNIDHPVVKNLLIYSKNKLIKKSNLNKLLSFLKNQLNFTLISLDINFISGKALRKVNKDFLNHDFSTDIITFNYSGNIKDLEGEILISVDDAETNSKKYGVSFDEEILRLVIHGILHLLGYNDINSKEKLEMKRLENKLLIEYKNILPKER
ncbi:MAG: rRNA maturation RNase YbeY [Ignavibacteria bacterium]